MECDEIKHNLQYPIKVSSQVEECKVELII